ncbi:hypothetical protein PHLGIDRAFT_117831 [Phlebiopsis gigantea 11061_1 CR5-6]|uniref:Protein kinase domain-containing protein n=1 Tax=Phlebiopsis gigantea (strain 11061_1 CR5-6) TaxID=745531 RepID=A0A0C3S8W7_PHLG1|nr:hypothetical protein PHLGIDRAFT_117831 [Phlebiopsis gigantea 11061_1 CR5-6]
MPNPGPLPCKYRTGKTLGKGSVGLVREAVHVDTGGHFACKIICKERMRDRQSSVKNEIDILKRLGRAHANVVHFHEAFHSIHNVYIILDLCADGDLFQLITEEGPRDEKYTATITRFLFDALQYIHSLDIVHRDIKPENILFRNKADVSSVVISDFGLGRVLHDDSAALVHICGTPGYMAPEIHAAVGYGKPVDIWALAMTAIFVLQGDIVSHTAATSSEGGGEEAHPRAHDVDPADVGLSLMGDDFLRFCLEENPHMRPDAGEALGHPWLLGPGALRYYASDDWSSLELMYPSDDEWC